MIVVHASSCINERKNKCFIRYRKTKAVSHYLVTLYNCFSFLPYFKFFQNDMNLLTLLLISGLIPHTHVFEKYGQAEHISTHIHIYIYFTLIAS